MLTAHIISDYNDIMTIAFYFDMDLYEIVAGNADDMIELLEYVFDE